MINSLPDNHAYLQKLHKPQTLVSGSLKPRTHDKQMLANMCLPTMLANKSLSCVQQVGQHFMLANNVCRLRTCSFLLANKRETVRCDWLAIVNMATSEWTDDAVAELTAMYEKYPCLYDTSTHDYRNKKQLQKSLLQQRRRRLLSRPSPPHCCPTFVGQHLFVVCPRLKP